MNQVNKTKDVDLILGPQAFNLGLEVFNGTFCLFIHLKSFISKLHYSMMNFV